jgi:hypothetical protein
MLRALRFARHIAVARVEYVCRNDIGKACAERARPKVVRSAQQLYQISGLSSYLDEVRKMLFRKAQQCRASWLKL